MLHYPKMHKTGFLQTLILLVAAVLFPIDRARGAAGGVRDFDGFYNFAWIGDSKQKELDLGTSDFLIVFRLNAAEEKRRGLPPIGIVSKKPFGIQPGYCVAIDRDCNLLVYLNDEAREARAEPGYTLTLGRFVKPGQWIDGAVACRRAAGQVAVYAGGKKARVFSKVMLGNIDNHAAFMVGVGNLHNHIRFRGKIAYVGVFKFPGGLPKNLDASLAKLARSGTPPAQLTASGRYSFWKLDATDKGTTDTGNNGNFLYYMPENEALRFAEMNAPHTATAPRTLHVDSANPNATDDGEGAPEKPFRSVGRAAAFARAGDTVIVHKGVYREHLRVSGGRRGAPIRIVGKPGAVISGAEVLADWKKADVKGAYVLRGWKGNYFGPKAPRQTDARKNPNSIIYVDGYPADWVEFPEDLYPGAYTIWPREKKKPKDLYLYPLPGLDIATARVEINTCTNCSIADHIELDGLTFAYNGITLNGRGCVVKNCTIKWAQIGIAIYGADHKIVNNRILWSGNSGLSGGAGASGCLIEGNLVAYSNWRAYDPNWHGAGAKIIPAFLDGTIRRNVFELNWGGGFKFDAYNSGNVVEYNVFHDNSRQGSQDEISWGNTFRYNIAYNNWCNRQNRSGGQGMMISESSDDVMYRNIIFNSERGIGIMIRGYASRAGMKTPQAVFEYAVKYPHHYLSAARNRRWLDNFKRYVGGEVICQLNMKYHENISFNNHLCQLWTMRDYRKKEKDPRDEFYSFESDNNIFYYSDPTKIVRTGMFDSLSLDEWRKVSGKDAHSRIIDPFGETEKLPEWARELFDFKAHASLRTAKEIADLNVEIHDGIGSPLFKSRICRAGAYRKLKFKDLTLRGYMMDVEGLNTLVLWRTQGAGKVRVRCGSTEFTLEDRWLRRRKVRTDDGKVTVFVGRDPIYLMGVSKTAAVDPTYKSVLYGTSATVQIRKLPRTFSLDGKLREWTRGGQSRRIADLADKRSYLPDSARAWDGPRDCAAKVYAGWRADGLYFAFGVRDDSLLAGKDVIELFIDGREEWRHFFTEYQHPGVFHIALKPNATGKVEVTFPPIVVRNIYHRKKPPVGVKAVGSVRKGTYSIEVFVPWHKNFPGPKLTEGTVLRVGVLVRDSDAGKNGEAILRWHAERDSHSDTRGWLPVTTEK